MLVPTFSGAVVVPLGADFPDDDAPDDGAPDDGPPDDGVPDDDSPGDAAPDDAVSALSSVVGCSSGLLDVLTSEPAKSGR